MELYSSNIDITKSQFDQSTFYGRFQHFFKTTSPLNCLKTNEELDKSKFILDNFKSKKSLPGVTEEQLWNAKYLYESAFHADTGEKIYLPGRMACQMPANALITGALITFYKSTPSVVFWQWFNQSFNAFVNYCNRSGDSPITPSRLGFSYFLATSGALSTVFYINSKVKHLSPIFARFVPFTAVMAANFINISCMRSKDLTNGITIINDEGVKVAESKSCGRTAIFQVAISRIFMCTPVFPPFLINYLEKRTSLLVRYPWASGAIQTLMCGTFLIVTTPMGCAFWPQVKSIRFEDLESSAQDQIRAKYESKDIPSIFYYNKGL